MTKTNIEVIDWLFERIPEGYKPQVVMADENKRALAWMPGTKPLHPNRVEHNLSRAKYLGCTQLAYESWLDPMTDRPCYICWIGLDIDELPIYDDRLQAMLGGSLRASCGGAGRHLLFRLDEPIKCASKIEAGVVVKHLTAPLVKMVEDFDMAVCKADCRAFYLVGGQNRWISKSDLFWHADRIALVAQPAKTELVGVAEDGMEPTYLVCHKEIQAWLNRFIAMGVLKSLGERNPVYIGSAVEVLREAGEVVETKSRCSGNGQINGYIDFGHNWIQLWSYADGHAIWRWTVV